MTLVVLLIAGLLALVALLAAGLLARLLGFPVSDGAWRDHPVTFYGAFLVGGSVFAFLASSQLRWLLRAGRARAAYIQAIAADISSGDVAVEDHEVVAVKRLQEPEHHAFIFLLRLSNGKTLVLHDETDSDNAVSDNVPGLTPRERISLRTFANSRRRRWEFSGAPLPLPPAIELVLTPDTWPEDESWCRVKWENIEAHFGRRGP